MNDYIQHVFYKTHNCDINIFKDIIHDAYDVCYDWWVDILDCSTSFARQKIEMPLNDVLKMIDDRTLFTVIHRKGYKDNPMWKWHGEIGFRTMSNSADHFLWICIEEPELEKLVNKYKLEMI